MYKFEKLLQDNEIAADGGDLGQGIKNKIAKFRKIQADITAAPDDKEGNDKRTADLEELDEKIYKQIETECVIIDEEMEEQKKLDARAQAVGLPAGSTEAAIKKAETAKQKLADRAKAAGLPLTATEAEVKAKEDEISSANKTAQQKAQDLARRAKAVGLPDTATEAEVTAAEGKAAAAKAEEDKPATSNAGALEKLFKQGKKTVTIAELKAAGFSTGFFTPLGHNGCTCGAYRLYRDDAFDTTLTLTKIGA